MGMRSFVDFGSKARVSSAVRAALANRSPFVALGLALMATNAGAQNIDEVVVTGVRLGIETAQEIKRNSDQIVDSVAAVDISALPDRTVTEALQRVPGVTIDRMFSPNDTNRFSAEGSGVLVRGLTQVRSELNGRDVFSARNTRALSFDDVPAELMAGVDVYKNPAADQIEGGIAGTVNLRTRKPFDSNDMVFGASGSLNYGDFAEEAKPQASVLFSNSWETGVGRVGILANVAYSEIATRTDSIQYGRPFRVNAADVGATNGIANCDGMGTTPNFTCVFVPQGVRWSELDFDRERIGYSAALQWAPTDNVEVYAQVLRSDYEMQWTEHSAWFQDWVYDLRPAPGTAFSFDSNGIFRSGTFVNQNGSGVGTGTTTRIAETNQVTTDYSIGLTVNATERLSLGVDLQYVEATGDNHDYTVNTSSKPSSLTLDMTGSLPRISLPTGYTTTAANYFWEAAMDMTQKNKGEEFAAKLDAEYAIDSGWVKSLRAGLRYADREATNRDTGYNWAPITETWNGASELSRLNSVLTNHSTFFSFDNFYRGRTSLPSGIWVANDALVRNLIDNADTVQSAGRGGWVWAPDKFGEADVNRQQEKSTAGFGMLRFGGDIGSRALDGNVGVRVVKVDREASGFVQLPSLAGNPLDPALIARWGTGAWQPVSVDDSDTYTLPSLNVRFKITDDLQARFAASKAIAYPSFDKQRATTTLSATLNDPQKNQVLEWTGTGGNPLLEPMKANQYDTSLEWYFAPSGSLTGTLFYKDVKDYFINGESEQEYFGNTWIVQSTVNGDEGVIKGFEVGYSQFYDGLPSFLSGLGLQANFTYVDSVGSPGPTAGETTVPDGLPLEGLSKTSYNVIAMYQRGRVEARLAYNWRERWLLTTTDGDDKGTVWNDDFGQLDGSVFVRLGDNMQIGLEANNLTNATQKLLVGPYKYKSGEPDFNRGFIDNRLYQNAWFTFDRRVALTLRLTF